MKVLLLGGLLGWGGCQAVAAQPAVAADSSVISCRIRPEKFVYKQGEVISFGVELWNKSATAQTLAYSVDGSEAGWRCPAVEFTVHRLGPRARRTPVKPDLVVRCGNMDAMREEDFVQVRPGAMLKPCADSRYSWSIGRFDFQHLVPGEYEVVFTYSTTPYTYLTDRIEYVDWYLGADGQELPATTERGKLLHALVEQVPALKVRSNVIHLSIVK